MEITIRILVPEEYSSSLFKEYEIPESQWKELLSNIERFLPGMLEGHVEDEIERIVEMYLDA